MSLIIGVRCKDGCLLIADYRNRINKNGVITYEDNFEKVVIHNGYLIYNHGYNRIKDEDWKNRYKDLTPDDSNPIYKEILDEMSHKPDKKASYVFLNKIHLHEITIEVGRGVTYANHLQNDRIVSGTGEKYVDLKLLVNLRKQKCKKVHTKLKATFENAYYRMKYLSGNEFSEKHNIKQLLS